MKTKQYLKTFFEEKNLPFESWEIEDERGSLHFINNEVVIENIIAAGLEEQSQIVDTIRKIDFANGNVNHFLQHLAKGLVVNYEGSLS